MSNTCEAEIQSLDIQNPLISFYKKRKYRICKCSYIVRSNYLHEISFTSTIEYFYSIDLYPT